MGSFLEIFSDKFNLIVVVIVLILNFGVSLISPVLGNVISSILNFFFTPFLFTFGFLIYEDLKRRKKGLPFEPPKRKRKLGFILIGIAGILLIPIILVSTVSALKALKGVRERSVEVRITNNFLQIQIVFQIIYSIEGIYQNVDCFHPEIVSYYDDIEKQISKKPIIHSPFDAYYGYIELPTTEKFSILDILPGKQAEIVLPYYHCIDSTLRAEKTIINLGQKDYCDGITFVCRSS